MSNKVGSKTSGGMQLNLVRMYVRDISFEAPHVTDLLTNQREQMDTRIAVEPTLNFRFKKIQPELFEAVAHINLRAKSGTMLLYLLVAQQVALIAVRGMQDESKGLELVQQAVPSIMLPHISELVGSLTARSSLPPVDLINLEVGGSPAEATQAASGSPAVDEVADSSSEPSFAEVTEEAKPAQ